MARAHIDEGVLLRELADEYKLDITSVKYFVSLYRMHGEKVFIDREELGVYSRKMKLEAITEVLLEGKAIRQVALKLGLMDPTILGDWIKLYKTKGESAIQTTRRRKSYELAEEKLNRVADDELKERIKYLEAENEYLKKLHSLVLKRDQQPKKKLR